MIFGIQEGFTYSRLEEGWYLNFAYGLNASIILGVVICADFVDAIGFYSRYR